MFVRRCVALHGIAISAVGGSVEWIFYKPLTKALDGRDEYIRTKLGVERLQG